MSDYILPLILLFSFGLHVRLLHNSLSKINRKLDALMDRMSRPSNESIVEGIKIMKQQKGARLATELYQKLTGCDAQQARLFVNALPSEYAYVYSDALGCECASAFGQ